MWCNIENGLLSKKNIHLSHRNKLTEYDYGNFDFALKWMAVHSYIKKCKFSSVYATVYFILNADTLERRKRNWILYWTAIDDILQNIITSHNGILEYYQI